jgi:zinc protease
MVISTFSKNATVGETVKTILDEVKRLQRQPPTDAEREDAVSFIVGADPRSRETPSDVVDELWLLDVQGLERDFTSKLLASVRAVDKKELGKVADALVDETSLVIVVVGPANQLLPQLKKLGTVEVVKN